VTEDVRAAYLDFDRVIGRLCARLRGRAGDDAGMDQVGDDLVRG
jgi:hypothetical protein